jgi:hypothetical protein
MSRIFNIVVRAILQDEVCHTTFPSTLFPEPGLDHVSRPRRVQARAIPARRQTEPRRTRPAGRVRLRATASAAQHYIRLAAHIDISRICPGRHMATDSLWIVIASILATFDISKAIGDDGRVVEPSYEYVSALVRSVFFIPVHASRGFDVFV